MGKRRHLLLIPVPSCNSHAIMPKSECEYIFFLSLPEFFFQSNASSEQMLAVATYQHKPNVCVSVCVLWQVEVSLVSELTPFYLSNVWEHGLSAILASAQQANQLGFKYLDTDWVQFCADFHGPQRVNQSGNPKVVVPVIWLGAVWGSVLPAALMHT